MSAELVLVLGLIDSTRACPRDAAALALAAVGELSPPATRVDDGHANEPDVVAIMLLDEPGELASKDSGGRALPVRRATRDDDEPPSALLVGVDDELEFADKGSASGVWLRRKKFEMEPWRPARKPTTLSEWISVANSAMVALLYGAG